MTFYNLNSDMAEGYGPWTMGDDDGLLDLVHSANIACGYHAGDHNIMAKVMRSAAAKGVSIGSHPGFYDLHGFGRRQMQLNAAEIENLTAYQLGAAEGVAALVGVNVSHVKPHGALNNMACRDRDMADAIVRAVTSVVPNHILLAPALSELAKAGDAAGLTVMIEVFADRAYMPDGQLVPRNRADAMIHDAEMALNNCISMISDGIITAVDGSRLKVAAQSICVHGDEDAALAMVKRLKIGLDAAGFIGKTLPQIAKS
ncbi:MAG: LamB/YcsF family protein [Candidatus Puniceispirillales bacterium WSBS_2018_MAG_OTU23]